MPEPGNPEGQTGITLDQVMQAVKAALDEAISPINTRLNGQSAAIENLRKGKQEDPPTQQQKQPEGLEARVKALEAKDAELAAREATITSRQITQGVSAALQKHGVSDVLAADLAEVQARRLGEKLSLSESGDVLFRDAADAEPISVDQWAGLFMATDRGKAYIPPKRNPQTGGLDSAASMPTPTRVVDRTALSAGAVDPADAAAGKVALA